MSVYVDPLFNCAWGPGDRYKQACHMFADTRQELMQVAEEIGLVATWLQDVPRRNPHFDLTRRMRGRAIAAGAIALDRRAAMEKRRELRGMLS